MERYHAYDQFAWVYHRDWGRDFHDQAEPLLESLAYSRLAPGARVLDLCCGSGDLSRCLVSRGYLVTGVDGSSEMLGYAREHVRDAEFVLADARTFELPPVFDAALSTFDSLNHILDLHHLEAVFHNVHRALRPGGFLVFDLNMEPCFLEKWHGSMTTLEKEYVCITRGHYDPQRRIGTASVTAFQPAGKEGFWRRFDVDVLERCYSREEVLGALERAGFGEPSWHDAAAAGMQGDVGYGRFFFRAFKP